MAREVIALRLDAEEKARIEEAARGQRLTLSEFLRRCALTIAFRLEAKIEIKPEPTEQASAPELEPQPQRVPERPPQRSVVTTYRSFDDYRLGSPYRPPGENVIPPGPGVRNCD